MTGASKRTTLEMENWQKFYHHWVKAVKKWRPWKIESPSMCRRAETCTLLLTPCQGYTWVSQISPVMCVCVHCLPLNFAKQPLQHHSPYASSTPQPCGTWLFTKTAWKPSPKAKQPRVRSAKRSVERSASLGGWSNQPTLARSGSMLIGGLRCDESASCHTFGPVWATKKRVPSADRWSIDPTLLDKKKIWMSHS